MKNFHCFLFFVFFGAVFFLSPQSGTAETYEFVSKWGSEGSGDGQFFYPMGIAVDSPGYVYIADTENDRIQKFTPDGVLVAKWGTKGTSNGQFNNPADIAVDVGGYIYVLDSNNNRVQKFTPAGAFITKWGSMGSGDGQFNYPMGITTDGSGYIYVADTDNSRIQKFTPNGVFITKWSGVRAPKGVAVDPIGYVYVADTGNNRIQKFTLDGDFVAKWGSEGSGNGQFEFPDDVEVDGNGNVYVADLANFRIQKFTLDGDFVAKWGSEGSGNGQFSGLAGAASSANFVYTVETLNHRVQKFQLSGGGQQWSTAYNLLLPDEDSLDMLRRYRDEVLRSSELGHKFVSLLYRHSNAALYILLTDRKLLADARGLLSQHLDTVDRILAGHEGVINNTVKLALFLETFAQKSPPELKTVLLEVRNAMLKAKKAGQPFLGFRLK